jgi:alpha-glucoside transport system substrate-binding protein
VTRRLKVLVLLVVLLLVGVGVALWPQRRVEPVTILGPWTDIQGEQFEKVLRGFGVPFEYQGTAALREVLLSKVQSGEPPDIAIMPGLGELAEYAAQHRLKPLDGLYADTEYDAPWNSVGRARGHVYWVPVKADLKSIVWYRRSGGGAVPAGPPASLDGWCLGMGDDGTSGWPGSDWIEDLVLQREGPGAYGRWALGERGGEWTGAAVRGAWQAWVELLRPDRTAAEHALLTDHRGTPGGHGLLFDGWGGCALEHQGSFARFFYRGKLKQVALTDSAPLLPGGPYPVLGHEVTGDFAALFGNRPRARELLRRLASREGQQTWADAGAVFSANRRVRAMSGGIGQEITRRLTGDGPRCLDASDVMPPAVRNAFYEAVLLTIARTAEGKDPDLSGLLGDVQRVAAAHSSGVSAPRTVCSAG